MSRFLTATVALILLLLAGASPASALVLDVDGCADRTATQAFKRYLDPAWYVLARNGTFEGSTKGWDLDGARLVADNETAYLNERDDVRSLAIPSGSVVTSTPNCVSLAHPTIRFMARSTGSPLAMLYVTALLEDRGLLRELPVGVVSGLSSAWRPTLPMLLLNGLVDSAVGGTTQVSFRFRTLGAGGAFRIDDLYIDPYGRG